ncbi:hypothetical protein [Erythrobacter litoralis]|uniref:hypothetical protein n=1 Tax=Erythrobacter litoralis TaxID=39960 RepID=UPI00243563D1|nr:hypothetical protein [Erythrobacter litoralis]
MENRNNEVHVSEVEASGGSKEGVGRWVLLGGTLLAIILLSIVWIIPAIMEGDVEEEATVSGEIQSRESDGDSTDSIVGAAEPMSGDEQEIGDQTEMEDGLSTVEN